MACSCVFLHACSSSLQGDNAIEPTTANYTYKHILEVQNTVYEIGLGPSQLKEVRAWHMCLHSASHYGISVVNHPCLSCEL